MKNIDTNTPTLVDPNRLNIDNSPIDIKGDINSYGQEKNTIKNSGINHQSVLIDEDENVIFGHRIVLICKELDIKQVQVIYTNKNMSQFEKDKLTVDLFFSQRVLTYLDEIKLHYHQKQLFEKNNQPYTKYMGEYEKSTQRTIQTRVKYGKDYLSLSQDIKTIFQKIDSQKKIPLKIFSTISELEDMDLKNYIKEVMEKKDISYKDLVSINNEYFQMLERKKENKKINEKVKKSKEKKEGNLNDEDTQDKLTNLENNAKSKDETVMLTQVKKVFQYEIKKQFQGKIELDEEREIKVIQSQLHLNFDEEIKLIISLIKGQK